MTAGSHWQMTKSSSVGNVVNSGIISLSDTSSHTPDTLTINGNYVGNNGKLIFNAKLGDDYSLSDKLLIHGNSSGTTNVSVNNVGGTGAQTIDGFEIIHVNGSSTAGAFKQQGRIVAGAYDYTLKERDNSWYLVSQRSYVPPKPIPPKPIPPKPIIHLVRPEAGTYIANHAASSMFLATLHDRAGGNRYMNAYNADGSISSLWLRQVGSRNQFHDNSGQLRTTGNTYATQLGGNLIRWSSNDRDSLYLGVMAGYGNNHNKTHSTLTGHNARGSVEGHSVGLYGTWYQNAESKTGAYADGQLIYNWFNNHVKGDGISGEKYKSKGLIASMETGYTFALGKTGAQDNPTTYFIEPQAQVTWLGVKSDGVTEENGTKARITGDNDIQTRLGTRAFMQGHNRMDNGRNRFFQPFVEINWLHNTKRNGVIMNGVALKQVGATNIEEIKLGVEGQMSRQMELWGNVGQQLGNKSYRNTEAILGIKYAF